MLNVKELSDTDLRSKIFELDDKLKTATPALQGQVKSYLIMYQNELARRANDVRYDPRKDG